MKCKQCENILKGSQKTYCSNLCLRKNLGRNSKKGKLNPMWKGGKSRGYGRSLLDSIKNCQKCRKEIQGHNKNIHHIDGNPKNNELKNLIALCVSCHQLTKKSYWNEENTKKIINLEKSGLNKKQISKEMNKTIKSIEMKLKRLDEKIMLDITVRADTQDDVKRRLTEAVEVAQNQCELLNMVKQNES